MKPVQLFCWHFMAYPYLDQDFDRQQGSGWVTVPNRLWDNHKARGLYQEYIDQLVYADDLGFDGMVLNEHHQNIYGLMPSPNIIAAAPTLVIGDEHDAMVPRSHGETYARLILSAGELKVIPNAGHSVQVEEADATARLVMEFLAL
jgi:pimeloyl-ACP methyl ester carboxylesterase